MALRIVRVRGDEVLGKKAKKVRQMTPRIRELIDDMFETMYEESGVGLAAPQVGVLRRIFVIDVDGETPMVFINPEIIEESGEQIGNEGCLSIPGKIGTVKRPMHVVVRAFDEEMNEFELEAEELLARAICHEYDHLEGILYDSLVNGPLREAAEEAADEDEDAPVETEDAALDADGEDA